ncbi:MAG TPA: tripartite tricarboxylate transporter TctB family protein [Geminicoccaceae bacterium]
MLPKESRRKADVVVCVLFILLGATIIYRASMMPWLTSRTGATSQWFTSPGLFPVVIGTLLILFSLRILVTAVRDGGHRGILPTFVPWLRGLRTNTGVHRVVFIIAWLGLYIFGGIGRIGYELASAIFLFGFIAVFWLPGSGPAWKKRLGIATAVAILVPIAVAYVFSTYFYVPSP